MSLLVAIAVVIGLAVVLGLGALYLITRINR
jgi:hypothetical protein